MQVPENSKTTAFVTGGSGFIGSEVIRQLTARGVRVRALMRKTSPTHNLRGVEYEQVAGDLSNVDALKAGVADVDYVFHLAGCISARTREEYFRHNAQGTANLAQACAEANSKKLRSSFDYIFKDTQLGGGKPMLDLHLMKKARQVAGVWVQPLELIHGRMPVLGYRINDVAYLTDCSYIPERTFRHLRNLKVLVLDCLRFQPHATHLNVENSLKLAQKIGAKRTYFTHMGHELDYKKFGRSLPRNMYPAYDGLTIDGGS